MYIHVKDLHNIHTDKHAIAKCKTITLEGTINDIDSLSETNLGERVKKLRLLNNLTIRELSKLSCVSENTITNIEKSRTIPNITTITKLSQALNATNAYLLNTEKWPENTPAKIIYKYRMIIGLSQRQLAIRCNLHYSTIQDYEKGRISNPDTLKVIYNEINYTYI